jgi:putative membrane protein
MMKHLMSTLSSLPAVALLMGAAACGGSHSKQANTPPSNEYGQTPATSEQYGSAMGQPAPAGTEGTGYQPPTSPADPSATGAGAGPSTQGSANGSNTTMQQYPGNANAPGSSYGGTTGGGMTGSQYGGTGTTGSQSGSTGSMGSTQSQYGSTGTMGGSQSGSTGAMGGSYGSTGTTGTTSTMGGSMDVSTLSDGQLAAVLQAINQGEIQQAQLAESRAQSPEVKKLAQHMMTAHQNMQTKAQAMMSRLQLTPSDNAVSQQIQTDAQNDLSTLQSMRGREFDRDYVQAQIKGHNQAIEMLDRMIPTVKSPEMKTELMNLRPKLQAHLQEAERVQSTMQKGTTNTQGTKP